MTHNADRHDGLLSLFNHYENTRFEADAAFVAHATDDLAELRHKSARERLVEALGDADAAAIVRADAVPVPVLANVKHRDERLPWSNQGGE